MNTYAAKVENGTVTQVIVGDPAWAADRLGGTWVASPVKIGVGWEQYDGGLRPPSPYLSWTWNDGWQPPVPQPDGDVMWDENAQQWVEEGNS